MIRWISCFLRKCWLPSIPNHFILIVMVCITSINYSLLLNGRPTLVFQAKKGLRQGDPLSHLLFVIGMEYLSRILRSEEDSFGFHPMCRRIKFSHICFADDLMLFCKGDVSSVRTLHQCISRFSQALGLHANASKSAIYTIGVAPHIQSTMIDLTHFSSSTLPFRYLGVLPSSKRLSIADCEKLADKMTSKIPSWQSKHLSYVALQLIN